MVYTPQADFFGTDTFTYTIDDGQPASTAVGTVTVTVRAVNDRPMAVNDTVSTPEDTALLLPPSALTGNDRAGPANEASQPLRIVPGGLGTPDHGTVSFDGTNVIYTPPADFNGTDRFTYTIDDGDPASTAAATVTVTVTAVDDPPVAVERCRRTRTKTCR